MDALPVTEMTDVPFKSRQTAVYKGEQVGVMHACGHDVHTAVLLGVAEVLAGFRDELKGNVLFIFQPAEEGPPEGEEGGAALMLEEGVLDGHEPGAIVALHVTSRLHVGNFGYRRGPLLAAADAFSIAVTGTQTHGARPWQGADPIVATAQLVSALQTLVSRRIDISLAPAVVTIGSIKGGIRHNIIPDVVTMDGTIRTFRPDHRTQLVREIEQVANGVGTATGTDVEFSIFGGVPVTVNDPGLTDRLLPALERAAGSGDVIEMPYITGAEDFSYFAERVPGFYFFVGATPEDVRLSDASPNHSPRFYVDEDSVKVALQAFLHIVVDYFDMDAEAFDR